MSEFLMLAHKYEDKHNPSGMFVSLKLDGQRCLWDGGITRGLPKVMVPWGNQDKDGRYIDPPVCTGLYSRYGNIIHAPKSFLDALPTGVILDGELWLGRGRFEEGRSITSTLVPNVDKWREITFNVFDMPSLDELFKNRTINNPNFKKEIVYHKCLELFKDSGVGLTYNKPKPFESIYRELIGFWQQCGKPRIWKPLTQHRLPEVRVEAQTVIDDLLNEEASRGGEGLMLRAAWSYWVPERMKQLLKVKKLDDDEAVVIGYTTGKEGKLLGLMGAVLVKNGSGKIFELSGFTDHERQLIMTDGVSPQSRLKEAIKWAEQHPGVECPKNVVSVQFPIGTKITYRYRGVTNDGKPREARYWRFG